MSEMPNTNSSPETGDSSPNNEPAKQNTGVDKQPGADQNIDKMSPKEKQEELKRITDEIAEKRQKVIGLSLKYSEAVANHSNISEYLSTKESNNQEETDALIEKIGALLQEVKSDTEKEKSDLYEEITKLMALQEKLKKEVGEDKANEPADALNKDDSKVDDKDKGPEKKKGWFKKHWKAALGAIGLAAVAGGIGWSAGANSAHDNQEQLDPDLMGNEPKATAESFSGKVVEAISQYNQDMEQDDQEQGSIEDEQNQEIGYENLEPYKDLQYKFNDTEKETEYSWGNKTELLKLMESGKTLTAEEAHEAIMKDYGWARHDPLFGATLVLSAEALQDLMLSNPNASQEQMDAAVAQALADGKAEALADQFVNDADLYKDRVEPILQDLDEATFDVGSLAGKSYTSLYQQRIGDKIGLGQSYHESGSGTVVTITFGGGGKMKVRPDCFNQNIFEGFQENFPNIPVVPTPVLPPPAEVIPPETIPKVPDGPGDPDGPDDPVEKGGSIVEAGAEKMEETTDPADTVPPVVEVQEVVNDSGGNQDSTPIISNDTPGGLVSGTEAEGTQVNEPVTQETYEENVSDTDSPKTVVEGSVDEEF